MPICQLICTHHTILPLCTTIKHTLYIYIYWFENGHGQCINAILNFTTKPSADNILPKHCTPLTLADSIQI